MRSVKRLAPPLLVLFRDVLEERNRSTAEHKNTAKVERYADLFIKALTDILDPERVPGSRTGNPGAEQAVTFHLRPGQAFDLQQIEEGLESAADAVHAEYDGNGVALDGSLVEFFLYGEDADALFDATASIVRRAAIKRGSYAVKRYGSADDPSAREMRINL